jgi:hypothetical protein
MAEPQLALGQARGVQVATGGLAWLRVWKELPDLDLHHTDHAHSGYKGSLVSAMVIYDVVMHARAPAVDPREGGECAARPGDSPVPCPKVSPRELDVFERAAWEEASARGVIATSD